MAPGTVLLVDAHAESRNVHRLILQHAGYRILEVSDGEEAIRAAHRERPCLIISEMTLPVLDGVQVTRLLKADPGTRHIPILILTATNDHAGKREAAQSGCDGFLLKPCRPQELLEEVERSVARGEMQVWTEVLALPTAERMIPAEIGP